MVLFFKKNTTKNYLLIKVLILLSTNYSNAQYIAKQQDTLLSKKEYNLALMNYQKEDFNQAIIHLNKGVDANPKNALCFALRAEIYRLQSKIENALKDINYAISLESEDVYWYYIRGYCLMKHGNYKDAILDLTKFISTSPKDETSLVDRAFCYMELKLYKEGLDDMILAISKNNYANYYIQKGELDFYLANYKNCISDFNTYLKMGGKNYKKTLHYFRGMSYYKLDNIDSTLIDLKIYLKYGEPSISVYNKLSYCYALKKDSVNARKYILKSLKLDSVEGSTIYDYARIEYLFHNYKQAKIYCQKAINSYGNKEIPLGIYNLRGLTNVHLNDTIAALKDYEQAIKLDNRLTEPHFNKMCLLYDDKNKINIVINECDEIITSRIDSSELCYIYNLRAFAKFRYHDSLGAENDFKAAIKLSKNKPFLYYNLATFYLFYRKQNTIPIKEVFNYLSQAITLDDKYIKAYKLLAICYYYNKNFKMVCDILKKASNHVNDNDLIMMKKVFCLEDEKLRGEYKLDIPGFEYTDGKSMWMKFFLENYK